MLRHFVWYIWTSLWVEKCFLDGVSTAPNCCVQEHFEAQSAHHHTHRMLHLSVGVPRLVMCWTLDDAQERKAWRDGVPLQFQQTRARAQTLLTSSSIVQLLDLTMKERPCTLATLVAEKCRRTFSLIMTTESSIDYEQGAQ